MSPRSTTHRLSKDLAARVLDRAASIDAAEERVDIETLRAAAYDAGISPESFERALSETAASARESPRAPERLHAYDIAAKALWVGALSGTAAIVLASAILGADKDATAGAIIGGGGAIIGVFIHLLRKFRQRDQ